MKASELFALMHPSLAADIVEFNASQDKELFHAVLEMVSQLRKVRMIYLQRLPRAERRDLVLTSLARPQAELAASNLIRNWLLKKHTSLLTDFLDGLKVPHEKGVVENLPESVEDAALQRVVEALLAKHPAPVVGLYLQAFNTLNETRWPNLELLLNNEARLDICRPLESAASAAPAV